jgi:hypothetical protein
LQRDAETDFNNEEAVCRGLFEDAKGFVEIEGFTNNRRGVDLEARVGEFLLGVGEESGFVAVLGKVPESEEGD